MKVRITNKPIDRDLSTDVLTIDEFNDIAFHPYLQSVQCDSVIIYLDPSLKRSYISQIFKRNFRIIPVIDKYPITNKEVLILMEMLPESSAEVMKAHREGTLQEYMEKLSVLYNWKALMK